MNKVILMVGNKSLNVDISKDQLEMLESDKKSLKRFVAVLADELFKIIEADNEGKMVR